RRRASSRRCEMLASWMLYSCVVGLLVGGAAAAIERILRDRRLPGRGAWCGALVLSVAVPLLVSGSGGGAAADGSATTDAAPLVLLEGVTAGIQATAAPLPARTDAFLLRAWIGISAGLLVLLALAVFRLS